MFKLLLLGAGAVIVIFCGEYMSMMAYYAIPPDHPGRIMVDL